MAHKPNDWPAVNRAIRLPISPDGDTQRWYRSATLRRSIPAGKAVDRAEMPIEQGAPMR
jgi:hypothetical protein